MVLGEFCTRCCRFCSVKSLASPPPPDPDEPENLARAVSELGLKYVVITSVDRDGLPDYGAGHFAECIRKLKTGNPGLLVEALVPDFNNDRGAIRKLTSSGVDVLGHNIETVERLTPKVRDRRAGYAKSLEVLRTFKTLNPKLTTKSSIMLGLGESRDEVLEAMRDLHEAGVDILTIGQYLRPTKQQLSVERYVPPEEFGEYEELGREIGFRAVLSGPFVRSSYKAAELFSSLSPVDGRPSE
jgi:lipoic acid synthetase